MKTLLSVLLLFLLPVSSLAQSASDPNLLAEINRIKAIDNHAHPMAVAREGEVEDEDFDAIACGKLEFVSPPPLRLRLDNPIYADAWRALYGFSSRVKATDGAQSDETIREVLSIKRREMRERGDNYPSWVLDQLNIETMFANRTAPGRGLSEPRFRWVGYGDPLTLPLSTRSLAEADPDQRFFYSREQTLLKRNLSKLGIKVLPATLDQYLAAVVTPTIESQKRDHAVAIKFVAAYMRPLSFENPPRSAAARIYARYVRGGEPSWPEYKQLQDFLFRYVVKEAGRLGLPVHIHTGGGCGHFFNLSNSNPLLLESVLNDPSLRKTTFVLVHGGYPFVKETEFLLEKPNVFTDFSAQTFLLRPATLARVLREWLEYEPEKVMFGTDASPATPEVSWEESAWTTNKTAREALGIALTGMIQDGDITRDRALELARMVLRENASRLYR
jgi:predicted TIM-barrel fold metal-dependent hydrolase